MTIHSQMPYLGRKYIKVKLGKATSSSRLTEKDNRERSQGWWQNKLFSAVVVVVIVGRPLFLVFVVITVIGVAYGEGVVAVTIFVAGLLLIFSYAVVTIAAVGGGDVVIFSRCCCRHWCCCSAHVPSREIIYQRPVRHNGIIITITYLLQDPCHLHENRNTFVPSSVTRC